MTHSEPKTPVIDFSVPAEHSNAPLCECVSRAVNDYFHQLEGHSTTNLYEIMLAEMEKPLLAAALNYADGNQSRAAEILGLNRGTLRKKLKQYDLS